MGVNDALTRKDSSYGIICRREDLQCRRVFRCQVLDDCQISFLDYDWLRYAAGIFDSVGHNILILRYIKKKVLYE